MVQKKLRIFLLLAIYSVLLIAISSCTFNSENQRQKMIAEIADSLNKIKQTEMKQEEEKRIHEEEIKRREEEKLKENCVNMYNQLKNGLEQFTSISKMKVYQVFEDKIVDRERGTVYFHAIDKISIEYNVWGNSIFLYALGENQNQIELCLPINDRSVKEECRLFYP